jgi:hypothetical protein
MTTPSHVQKEAGRGWGGSNYSINEIKDLQHHFSAATPNEDVAP